MKNVGTSFFNVSLKTNVEVIAGRQFSRLAISISDILINQNVNPPCNSHVLLWLITMHNSSDEVGVTTLLAETAVSVGETESLIDCGVVAKSLSLDPPGRPGFDVVDRE